MRPGNCFTQQLETRLWEDIFRLKLLIELEIQIKHMRVFLYKQRFFQVSLSVAYFVMNWDFFMNSNVV